MTKSKKSEWSLFLNERNRICYNELCRRYVACRETTKIENCIKQAIVIKTVDGVKIGYVPKQDNVIFARLMDAGKLLFGRITSKEKKGSWVKIYIKVFLHE